jgi:CRP-like cAMP-binding protein
MTVSTELRAAASGKLGNLLIDSELPRATVRLGTGERLFAEGEPCGGVYVVVSGNVELAVAMRHGESVCIRVAEPGQVIGLVSAINHAPYSKGAVAQEPTVVEKFDAAEVVSFLHAVPDRWLNALGFLCADADAMQRLLAAAKSARPSRHVVKR